jgi:hypothetical protein
MFTIEQAAVESIQSAFGPPSGITFLRAILKETVVFPFFFFFFFFFNRHYNPSWVSVLNYR